MNEFKPCPFCGEEAYFYEQNYADCYVIECEGCGVRRTSELRESAIKKWNTRQLETELADKDKQLAEARAEIERLKATTIDASLLREKLAELAHNQWVGWMEYLFSKSKQVDGCVVIPAWANERWHRQVATRYADLSEMEKDSDRNEADRFLAVFSAHISERDKLIEQMREALELLVNAAGCGRISAGYIRQAKAALAAERGERL